MALEEETVYADRWDLLFLCTTYFVRNEPYKQSLHGEFRLYRIAIVSRLGGNHAIDNDSRTCDLHIEAKKTQSRSIVYRERTKL